MRLLSIWILPAAGTIAAAAPASAQAAYCMPNAPPAACFSLELLSVPADPAAGFPTLMTIRISNLQGSLNSDPSLFGIDFLRMVRTATPPTPDLEYGTDYMLQSVPLTLSASGGPVEFNPDPSWTFIAESTVNPDDLRFGADGLGIGGCASTVMPPEGVSSTIARTCAVQGLTGSVDVSFYMGIFEVATGTTRPTSFDDISLFIGGHVGEDGYMCSFNGATSGATPGTTCLTAPSTTVPEPGTLALLSAPALALAGRIRRKR